MADGCQIVTEEHRASAIHTFSAPIEVSHSDGPISKWDMPPSFTRGRPLRRAPRLAPGPGSSASYASVVPMSSSWSSSATLIIIAPSTRSAKAAGLKG